LIFDQAEIPFDRQNPVLKGEENMKRGLYFLLCLLLLLPLGVSAREEKAELYYALRRTEISAEPDEDAPWLGSVAKDQVLIAAGAARGAWLPILMANGKEGFVRLSELAVYEDPKAESGPLPVEIYAATRGLNVRKGPGLEYAIVHVLQRGELVLKIGQEGKWARILRPDGSIAYASSVYLEKVEEEDPETEPFIPNIQDVYYRTESTVLVRSGPGRGYGVEKELRPGTILKKTGMQGDWMEILLDASGAKGYVEPTGIVPLEGLSVVVSVADVNVRSGPGKNYGVLQVLKSGQAMVSIGELDQWTRVLLEDNSVAYVLSDFLLPYEAQSGGVSLYSNYQATTPLNVRSGPGMGYSIIGGLKMGQVVTAIGVSGSWTRIKTESGIEAYVFTKYLAPAPGSGLAVRTLTEECSRILANEARLQKAEGDVKMSENG